MNWRLFYHLNSHKIFFWLFIATFFLQILLWKNTENIKPHFDIVPPAPNKYVISALSLGDKEFLFRVLGTRLQNSGDVFAGFLSLKKYDYAKIYQWMKTLDTLNHKSRFIPSLASYYYSQTQRKEDTKYIVNYLDEHSSPDINYNWWWLFQATYIAQHNLEDMDLALKLATKLSKNNNPNAPFWTKQMPAFIYEAKGDNCMAFQIIEKLLQESEDGSRIINEEEMNFMRYFIKERLQRLKKQNFDPRKCKKN